MARRRRSRVVLNRSRVEATRLALADGLMDAGKAVIEVASRQAPDSPYDPYPRGEGLPKQGGVMALVDGKQVGTWHIRGAKVDRPRAARGARGTVVFAGFGFPGRFQEFGTVNHPAQPFLTPARDTVAPRIPELMRARMAKSGR